LLKPWLRSANAHTISHFLLACAVAGSVSVLPCAIVRSVFRFIRIRNADLIKRRHWDQEYRQLGIDAGTVIAAAAWVG
jgi:hypothetical protein